MSKFNYYDSKTKIWGAPPSVSVYNPKSSLGEILIHGLNQTPEKLAEYHDKAGIILSCADILNKSFIISEKLRTLHLKPGDVVIFACTNIPELTPIICGCILSGVVVCPINPNFQTDDYKEIIKNTEPKLIFSHKYNKIFIKDALEQLCHISDVINLDNELSVQNLFKCINDFNLDHMTLTTNENIDMKTALILMTSGTTGPPKCVKLTNSMVISQLLRAISITHDDIVLLSSSIHLFSGIATLLTSIANGAVRIVSHRSFDPEEQLKMIEKYKITKMFMSPAHLSALADCNCLKQTDMSSIRLIQTGGEALMKTLKETIESQLENGKVAQSYGLVEIGGTATLNYPLSEEYSVGRPVFENKFKIVDESGNRLNPGEEGEICIKPPYLFVGYCSNKVMTTKVIDDEGFIHTGDLGYFNNDSFLFIVGRCDEIIQYTGFQI